MSESLQGRRTTSNANTWVANSYYKLYDKENRCVLGRFLNVDGVSAVRMFRGKVFHAVGPATENARLPSWRLVHGTRRSPRTAERRAEHVAMVVMPASHAKQCQQDSLPAKYLHISQCHLPQFLSSSVVYFFSLQHISDVKLVND